MEARVTGVVIGVIYIEAMLRYFGLRGKMMENQKNTEKNFAN